MRTPTNMIADELDPLPIPGKKIEKEKPVLPEWIPVPGKKGMFVNAKGQYKYVPGEPQGTTMTTKPPKVPMEKKVEKDIWHKTKMLRPPIAGWYEASFSCTEGWFRYWNGISWSHAVRNSYQPVDREVAKKWTITNKINMYWKQGSLRKDWE